MEIKEKSWWMLRDSKGKPNAVLTMMLYSFILSSFMALFGMFETITLGDKSVTLRSFDIGYASVVLIPLIAAYVGRRYTDSQEKLKETQQISLNARFSAAKKKEEKSEEEGE